MLVCLKKIVFSYNLFIKRRVKQTITLLRVFNISQFEVHNIYTSEMLVFRRQWDVSLCNTRRLVVIDEALGL